MSEGQTTDAMAAGRTHMSPDPHVFTPPLDLHSPTKHDALGALTNGTKMPPMEIPMRESVPSASELPSSHASPPAVTQPFGSVSSTHGPWQQQWNASANRGAQTTETMEPEKNYLDLYILKQAQLEQAEKAHKELMEEVIKARSRAEDIAEKMQDELREEVKSVRKVEESLREKVEDQLRKEREIWNTERDMLMQKMKSLEEHNPFIVRLHRKEQENQALRMRIEQLKNRLRICEMKGCVLSGELSPGPEDSLDFQSPSRFDSSASSRRIASPDRRNGRQSSAERYSFYGSRRATPNTLKLQEVPYEPPATVAPPLSPPPLAYRRHAGHTPGASVSLLSPGPEEEGDRGADTPTQANFGSLAAIASSVAPAAESSKEDSLRRSMKEETLRRANEEVDDDLPLRGALGLRNDPEESTLFLEILDKKLEDVSNDPTANRPMVLIRDPDDLSVCSESIDGNSTHDPGESDAPAAAEDKVANEDRAEEEGEDEEPIPLKLKPSMNFGAPLGKAAS